MQTYTIFLLCVTAIGLVQACTTDLDCSLNGICGASIPSICSCDSGWYGDDCGHLDLAPATRGNGYNYTSVVDPAYYSVYGNSSWGGNIIQDPQDKGLFHLIADQFAHGCGLSGWRPASTTIRAESRTGPQGPFHYIETIKGEFHHNSYVFWSPADEKWLLYVIGVDYVDTGKCQSLQFPNNISVSSADDIRGPWTPFELILAQVTNPAPWPLWMEDDPTSEIILGVEDDVVYTADTFNGNYSLLSTAPWNTSNYSPTWTEDPFLWRDKRGNWHFLTHWLIDISESPLVRPQYPRVGAHQFAQNLTGPWYFHQHEAFNSTIIYTDGSIETLRRRERPKLFFSDDGEMTPLYLVSGVQVMTNLTSQSSTFIQPIGTKWKEFEDNLSS